MRGATKPVASMEPIPETVEAVDNLDPVDEDESLLEDLIRLAERAEEVIPDLVGVSLASMENGLTFTVVATAWKIAVLDAIQYAAGGPCVDGAHSEQVMEFDPAVLDEERWRLFAEATAARAVRSTLTLPVLAEGQVAGTVNLYAASARAFVGHHSKLASIFGAWAEGAAANADLSFATRREAEAAPQRIRDQDLIDLAAGILAAQLGIDVESALGRLKDGAARAGVTPLELAREITFAWHQDDAD
jgi:GAF domain-containing protein